MIPLAINSFLSQTYPNKELVILDNGEDQTCMIIPVVPEVRYYHNFLAGKFTIGDMRNRCIDLTRGEFICHFDSDDWSAPTRIEEQMKTLGDGVLTGYCDMLFYDIRSKLCHYWSLSNQRFALGTSLFYRKDWWDFHRFDDKLNVGEDYKFFHDALRVVSGRVFTPRVEQMMVATIHDDQTSVKALAATAYQQVDCSRLPKEFLALQHRE